MKDPSEVVLYTDGACSGNPGPGGWAFILHHVPTGRRTEASGGSRLTTNNRMELRAVVNGLERLRRSCRVRLVSDSEYVIRGMREWLPGWERRGWKRKDGRHLRPVRNADLWKRLADQVRRHTIVYEHVRGHSGHPENERCDELAVAAAAAAVANDLPEDLDREAETAESDVE